MGSSHSSSAKSPLAARAKRAARIQHTLQPYLVDDAIALCNQYAKQPVVLVFGGVRDIFSPAEKPLFVYDLASTTWHGGGQWPLARPRVAVASVGNSIHVCGGEKKLAHAHAALDVSSGVWTVLPPLPDARVDHSAVSLNGNLFVVGDATADSLPLLRFDVGRAVWEARARLNHGRAQVAATVCGGVIYVVGGRDSACVERYDPNTNKWTDCANLSTIRNYCAVAASDDAIYACSGERIMDNLTSCERYIPATGRWTPIADMHQARVSACAVFVEGHILVCGGYFWKPGALNTVESYDVRVDQWSMLHHMPGARNAAVAVVVD